MSSPEFAVIDVETTHGDPTKGHIIEVALVAHNGIKMLEHWTSLVRPRAELPWFIQRLTGIGPAMLADAPIFPTVAKRLRDGVEGRILVAHNVRYDLTALQHEFARTGLTFQPDTLCTERLCRQLMPGLSHYNLISLCRYFGIETVANHRALNDAAATLAILLLLRNEFGHERVMSAVTPWSHRKAA
jgi:DNA polymerase III subunit epsilon